MNDNSSNLFAKMKSLQSTGSGPDEIRGLLERSISENRDKHDFSDAIFENVSLKNLNFQRIKLSGIKILNCDISGSIFEGCDMGNAIISGHAIRTNFRNANLKGATLQGDFLRAMFAGAILNNAKITCQLAGADLGTTCIASADFSGSSMDAATSFTGAFNPIGATIDRFALECLGTNHGGLTRGNLIVMNINDDVAKLRTEFGGVWAMLHLISLIIFAAPYVWFLATHYAMARWHRGDADQTVTLGGAFARFIYSGGKDWQHWQLNFWSLLAFVTYLIYNIVRGCLVWKTKTLETKQEVTHPSFTYLGLASRQWRRRSRRPPATRGRIRRLQAEAGSFSLRFGLCLNGCAEVPKSDAVSVEGVSSVSRGRRWGCEQRSGNRRVRPAALRDDSRRPPAQQPCVGGRCRYLLDPVASALPADGPTAMFDDPEVFARSA